jgi:hypothetical protein
MEVRKRGLDYLGSLNKHGSFLSLSQSGMRLSSAGKAMLILSWTCSALSISGAHQKLDF